MKTFADEHVVRCLSYVEVATRAGVGLTVSDLDTFNEHEPPVRQTKWSLILGGTAPPQASMARYLQLMRWIAPRAGTGLVLTDLGAAVLDAHTAGDKQGTGTDSFELVIRPDVPLDYARLYERVSSFTGAFLVDAYMATEALPFFDGMVALERILIAGRGANGKDWKARRKDLENTLGLMSTRPEVRFLPRVRNDLHDRYVLPARGEGLMLGGSIGGRQPSAVVRLSQGLTTTIREHHEALWAEAEPIDPTETPSAGGTAVRGAT